jgi:uncharacterized Fe-S cluster protein YjdI
VGQLEGEAIIAFIIMEKRGWGFRCVEGGKSVVRFRKKNWIIVFEVSVVLNEEKYQSS